VLGLIDHAGDEADEHLVISELLEVNAALVLLVLSMDGAFVLPCLLLK